MISSTAFCLVGWMIEHPPFADEDGADVVTKDREEASKWKKLTGYAEVIKNWKDLH